MEQKLNNMKKIINRLFNDAIVGVDVYHHKGSVWLIFTDKKEWVVEVDNNNNLWYNYYFFENLFKYLSMRGIDNKHYITEWVEDILRNGIGSTITCRPSIDYVVKDTIKNGIRNTEVNLGIWSAVVDNTIKNGVKDTHEMQYLRSEVEDILKNGVKDTRETLQTRERHIEDTIQNGVKDTYEMELNLRSEVEDILKNGEKIN
jgi:hypothetical protein